MYEKKYNVFLSHCSEDKPVVEELARRLRENGCEPWLDKWNLIPGAPWQSAIEDALNASETCAIFIGPSGFGPWQNEEMRAAIGQRVSDPTRSFRVIPVLLPGAERGERSRLPSFLSATTWVEFRVSLDEPDALHRLSCGIRGIEPGDGGMSTTSEGKCPFKGLKFFDVDDSAYFFGREATTEWLIDAVRSVKQHTATRFLTILGASGSGKSSLARAGLLASLKRGMVDESASWLQVVIRPGSRPLQNLAIALSGIGVLDEGPSAVLDLADAMTRHEAGLHIASQLALKNSSPAKCLVVLVDQFEEVFTLCEDDNEREVLIRNLLHAARVANGRTFIFLTMRADFYHKCASHSELAAVMSDHQMLVGPMISDDLRRAIQRPAQLVGLEFEAGLVDMLIREVGNESGSLPLLQHALFELWQNREGRKLTHRQYQTIGGLKGALNRRADTIFHSLDPSKRELCKWVFLRLTQPGQGTPDTRRRVSKRELVRSQNELPLMESLIEELADARLITIDSDIKSANDTFIEVTHEALIEGWEELRGWIESDRESLRIQQNISNVAREWQAQDQDPSYLFRGSRLLTATRWADEHHAEMNPHEKAFLAASQELDWDENPKLVRARFPAHLRVIRFIEDVELRVVCRRSWQLRFGWLVLLLALNAIGLFVWQRSKQYPSDLATTENGFYLFVTSLIISVVALRPNRWIIVDLSRHIWGPFGSYRGFVASDLLLVIYQRRTLWIAKLCLGPYELVRSAPQKNLNDAERQLRQFGLALNRTVGLTSIGRVCYKGPNISTTRVWSRE